MKHPLVSVIVTTKNSEKTLHHCLKSVKNQTYHPVELILIDNHSEDSTVEIAKKYTKNIMVKGSERSEQRNIGIKKATGEFLLFLDADMYLDDKVIAECIHLYKSKHCKGVYIPEKIESDSYWTQVRNFERGFYNQTVVDAVRFVSKHDAEKIGKFDELLFAGEDWDFDKRIRKLGKTDITHASLYHNEKNFSIIDYIKKKAYYSPNLEEYRKKWKNDSEVRKQFSIMYRYLTVFTEEEKWIRLINHFDLAIGMFFLRILVGLTYLLNRNT